MGSTWSNAVPGSFAPLMYPVSSHIPSPSTPEPFSLPSTPSPSPQAPPPPASQPSLFTSADSAATATPATSRPHHDGSSSSFAEAMEKAKGCRACDGVLGMFQSFSKASHASKPGDEESGLSSARLEGAEQSGAGPGAGTGNDGGWQRGGRGEAGSHAAGSSAKEGSNSGFTSEVSGQSLELEAESLNGNSKNPDLPPCPPDTNEIGRSTWTFLHTAAAYYPEEPTSAQQALMTSFIWALGEFYPCHICADHLREYIHQNPPTVNSTMALSLWFCRAHNEVNKRTDKAEFDCSKVLERWRDGPEDGNCVEQMYGNDHGRYR